MARNYPRWLLRLLTLPPQFLYRIGLGPILGRKILLLTTRGRKSGLPRTTPLQYEQLGDSFFVGSMRGAKADWYQNLVADSEVSIRVGRQKIRGRAIPIEDQDRVYEFVRFRLEKSPRMIGAILQLDGLSSDPGVDELREYARSLTMVEIQPHFDADQTPTRASEENDA